jgi:hypothetical protein
MNQNLPEHFYSPRSSGIRGGGVWGAESLGKPPHCLRTPLKRSAALEKVLCVRRAPDASLSPGAWRELPVEAELTDWTSDTGLPPAGISELPPEDSEELAPWSPGALVPLFAGADPARAWLPDRIPTGIEFGVKPDAGRSPSNPEPARLSPPTEDKAVRVGGAVTFVDPLLPELDVPLLGD